MCLLLEIPKFENIDKFYERIQTLTLKAIVKFRKGIPTRKYRKRMLAAKSINLTPVKVYKILIFQSQSWKGM